MREGFLVSTTSTLEGYEIEKYLGLCSERVVVGAGFFSEFFAGFTDIFGGRSGAFEERLSELHEAAMGKLIKKAKQMGANALVGVKLDIDEISGKSMQMFMINAAGTAIVAKNSKKGVLKADEINDNKIFGKDIKLKVTTNNLLVSLHDSNSVTKLNSVIEKALNENILLPIDDVLKQLSKLAASHSEEITLNETELPSYIDLYDDVTLNTAMNLAILTSENYGNPFKELYITYAEPNYELIAKLLDGISSEYLVNMILPVLLKYKNNYNLDDIKYMEEICNKFCKIMTADVTKKVKGTFNKELWVCTCGRKVSINEEKCFGCYRGKNGFDNNECDMIKETIRFLEESIFALKDEASANYK